MIGIMNPVPDNKPDRMLRTLTKWITLSGTMALAAYGFTFIILQTIDPSDPGSNWIIDILHRHYAAVLGVPMCSVAAICIVLVLEQAAGPIEFEMLGLKLRGASGPVVLWVLVFLAMALAMRLLWAV